ncbi:hypothetical protein [Pandoraea commovens]|uniref:Uncharacterized protein n=2 Tax=Pandoraea commovens TaxID=2508289 RepID=A0ABY5QIA0_9BURK|nr:hypothetical protein [Pandoraea commovens]UVA79630.1 hypothetical protein NTU39_00880 [Pandoraea commovens]
MATSHGEVNFSQTLERRIAMFSVTNTGAALPPNVSAVSQANTPIATDSAYRGALASAIGSKYLMMLGDYGAPSDEPACLPESKEPLVVEAMKIAVEGWQKANPGVPDPGIKFHGM